MIEVLMFSLIASVAACSCEKGWGCDVEGGYQFEIPATLSPALDTFYIGDTISLKVDFGSQVWDTKTNQRYSLENFNFYPATSVFRIDTMPPDGDDLYSVIQRDFEVILDSTLYDYNAFQYSDGSVAFIGQYTYSSGRYMLNFKLRAKKKGLYTLRHLNRAGIYDDMQQFDGKCKDVKLYTHTVLNNDENTNIEFLHDSPRDYWNSWVLEKPGDRYYQAGNYTFYVLE